MAYKFEQLEVWQKALDYADQIHDIAEQLPQHERYNLADQMTRAANSIALNVAV
jgi:four helix bundle protein